MEEMYKFSDRLKDKYSMTLEQSVFVAKRNIVDYIWKSANLEGIAITFPQTEAIYEGLSVQGLKVNDIIAVNNLKRSWDFLLSTLDYPTDYNLICKFNQIIGGDGVVYDAGNLRKLPVSMGGTKWLPAMPEPITVREKVSYILNNDSVTDSAINLMLYCMRSQLFMDGNKRTSMLAANHQLIRNGKGIITVPLELQFRFRELLINYYEKNNSEIIKSFIYENCIDGINFD